MKQQSHISAIRKKYESNRLFILRATGLTDFQYNEILFNAGIMFLEEIYPRNTEYEHFYRFVAYDRDFWVWWISEWKQHENEFIHFIKKFSAVFKVNYYREQMEQIAHESTTEYRFYANYQKPKFNRRAAQDLLHKSVEQVA